ncbi:MAG: hypothetical protein JJU27_17655, partial [Gammaproteobacteria bacterium]|nr:hypothetical protein [Gammaproteobacteria bacterium]
AANASAAVSPTGPAPTTITRAPSIAREFTSGSHLYAQASKASPRQWHRRRRRDSYDFISVRAHGESLQKAIVTIRIMRIGNPSPLGGVTNFHKKAQIIAES